MFCAWGRYYSPNLKKPMNQTSLQLASDHLWAAWMDGRTISALPTELKPLSRTDGYAVQACLQRNTQQALYGWKIAATSVAGQKHIGVDGPMAGRILAERVKPEGAMISLMNNRMRVAECEFAFKMNKTLAPRKTAYTMDEALKAVASLHPAIEIPDSRYEKFETAGAPQLIADSACAHLFMLGQATSCNWRALNLVNHAVTASVTNSDGELAHHHGTGSNVLGDPIIALQWLVNELSAMGVSLEAGQVVTTGTCIVPIPVNAGDHVRVSFGPVGDIEVRFID
jgi:2-keto-4-pentenoate hydratase